jgi:hypothetical protein
MEVRRNNMFTLISALLGFLGGLAPELIKFLKDKQDKKHELNVMDKQAAIQSQLHTERLEEINIQGDISEAVALYKSAETKLTGYKLLDGLIELYNSGVRPTITYLVIALYASEKLDLTKYDYTEFDQSTLMLILGYWFGQRSAQKFFGKK